MNVLAIDTSQPTGSVALRVGNGEPVSRIFGTASSHLVEMSEAVEELLGRSRIAIADIDRVALVIGPGSFTGLRIGLSFAKGLYAGGGIDVVTVTSLELLAARYATEHALVCAMIDARKGEVYGAVYESLPGGEPGLPAAVVEAPRAASPRDFLSAHTAREMGFVGSGARRFEEVITEMFGPRATMAPREGDQPSTPLLCRLAERLGVLDRHAMRDLQPFYIRPSDARLNPLRRIRVHEEHRTHRDE